MKNPEEYLDEVHFHKNIRNTLSKILSPDGINDNMYERLLKALNLIQKDAYNQAIEDAINAEWRQHNGIEFTDEEMRIKLKIK